MQSIQEDADAELDEEDNSMAPDETESVDSSEDATFNVESNLVKQEHEEPAETM